MMIINYCIMTISCKFNFKMKKKADDEKNSQCTIEEVKLNPIQSIKLIVDECFEAI